MAFAMEWGSKQDDNNGGTPCDEQTIQPQQAYIHSEQRNDPREKEKQHQIEEFKGALLQYRRYI